MIEREWWMLASSERSYVAPMPWVTRRASETVPGAWVFRAVAGACLLFIVFTGLSMALFPGGTLTDPHAHGYRFFQNFLSDLGQTRTSSGAANYGSMVFFMLAMVVAGMGVPLFFIAFRQFLNASRMTRLLSRGAVLCSVMTATAFVGIAASPWNLYYRTHILFVELACCSFGLATALEMIAIVRQPRFPRAFLWAFGVFALIFGAYLLLWVLSPPGTSALVEVIEVTGQKVVIYGSIATLFSQALLVKPLLLAPLPGVTMGRSRRRPQQVRASQKSGGGIASRRQGASHRVSDRRWRMARREAPRR